MSDSRRFAYGQVRFQLLLLLAQQPRHGYELLAALSEKFADSYRPSPGTVYPRLRRMEAEGLVRHEETGGRKIYHLTDAGRQELERERDGSDSRTTGPEDGGQQGGTRTPAPPASRLSDAIRSEVEEIVQDFRRQVTSAMGRPADTSEHHDWLSWSAWSSSAPPRPRPSAREQFQQQLDELTEVAQRLLTADRTPDDSLRKGAQLLGDTTATLRSLLPPD